MSCWDRFDFVGCAEYIPYRHRVAKLDAGLARVGLAPRVERFWDFDTPFKDVLYNNVGHGAGIGCVGAFGCAMNHYRMVKTAYGLGAEHGLFMEDDIEFLKDTALLDEVVRSLPEDFDVAMLDWFRGHMTTDRDLADLAGRPRANGHWADMHGVCLVSCGLYALSRRAMDWLARSLEAGAAGKFRGADTFFRPGRLPAGFRAYCAFPHVAVQGDVEHGVHRTSKHYEDSGVDTGRYG